MTSPRRSQNAVLAGGAVLAAAALTSFAVASWRAPLGGACVLVGLAVSLGVAAVRARRAGLTATAEALGLLTIAVALTVAVGIRSVEPALAARMPGWAWGASTGLAVATAAGAFGRRAGLRSPALAGAATVPVAVAVALAGLGVPAGGWAAAAVVGGWCWLVAAPPSCREVGAGAWAATAVAGAVIATTAGGDLALLGGAAGLTAVVAARLAARGRWLVEVPVVVAAAALGAAAGHGHGWLWSLAAAGGAGVAGRARSTGAPSGVAVAAVAAPAFLVGVVTTTAVAAAMVSVAARAAGVHTGRAVEVPAAAGTAACVVVAAALVASLRPRAGGPVALVLAVPFAWSAALAGGVDVTGALAHAATVAGPWAALGPAVLAVAAALARSGGPAAVAATAAVVAACRLDLHLAAGPTGVVIACCAAAAALAQPRWRTAVLAGAGSGGLVALAHPPLVWATAAFAVGAAAAALVGAAEASVLSLTASGLVALVARGAVPDARSALLGVGVATASWLWMRRDPRRRSSALVPGMVVAALPTLAASVGDHGVARASALALGGALAVGAGLLGRLRGPLVTGAVVVVLTAAGQLGPVAAGAPRWVPLAVGAVGLLGAGACFDGLRRRTTLAHRALRAMR